ncbi:MAG: NAD(P)H-dependent oxidoreductase subunit E [Fervidobacterium sp.]
MEKLNKSKDENIVIEVCMGSSCHLKGSFEIVNKVKQILGQMENVNHSVVLKGSLCMGLCSQGVNVRINDYIISNLSPSNTNVLEEYLKNLLEGR